MKKYLSFFFLVSVVIGFAACSDDDDDLDKYQDWKLENEQFIDGIIASGEYIELASTGGYGSIYYKVLEAGNNEEKVDVFSIVLYLYIMHFILLMERLLRSGWKKMQSLLNYL